MQSKPKLTKSLKGVSSLKTAGRLDPPEWEMDAIGHFFANKFGLDSKIGKEIGALMREYEEKCAMAKFDLYAKIHKIVKEAQKEPW